MKEKLITGTCAICGKEIAPAATQAQFNRNTGIHNRTAHGIVSSYHVPKWKKKAAKEARLANLARARKIRWQKYRTNKPNARITAPMEPMLDGNARIVAPGLTLEFAAEYLPDVLHTLAFAMGGKRDWLTVTKE